MTTEPIDAGPDAGADRTWFDSSMPLPYTTAKMPPVLAELGERAVKDVDETDSFAREVFRRAAIRDGARRLAVLRSGTVRPTA
jgi:hypothetical protein